VHYSDLAERLGVNRFSAYDMLKVLEKKGLALPTYTLAAGHAGPGRSLVLFAPTAQVAQMLDHTSPSLGEEWAGVREQILNKLHEAREANYREVLDDLLTHLSDAKTPLTYCAEMIGILLLNMRRATARAGNLNPFRALAALRVNGEAGLETLAGLSVGSTLVADEESRLSLTQRVLGQAHRFQTVISRLGEDARSALSQLLEDALTALD
jgi:ATP-dependent exoDNAse (exonuclease V) alpha subunit